MSATGPTPPAPTTAPVVSPPAPVNPPSPHPGPKLLANATVPFQAVDYVLKGYHLDATVPAEKVVATALELDREGFPLDTITGVDWLASGEMEVVYDYFHPQSGLRVVIRTRVPRATPEVPTISTVFSGANWHERETHDFFGIDFVGHPNLSP